MNAWSNIQTSSNDPEIIEIDKYEEKLKDIPFYAHQIRELITRFEVCHFKYQQHIEYIKKSILNLHPKINPEKIGDTHIRNGEHAWKKDKTGRSLLGQRYIYGLEKWLGDYFEVKDLENDRELIQQIMYWLGKKNADKERLVRLLIARLIWDWKTYDELLKEEANKDLELQVCSIDVCHYNFPNNINLLIQGIGKMKPVKAFEGCGSYNSDIKISVEKEFLILNDLIKSIITTNHPEKNEMVKVWLIACLAKTLKEQTGLTQPVNGLKSQKN